MLRGVFVVLWVGKSDVGKSDKTASVALWTYSGNPARDARQEARALACRAFNHKWRWGIDGGRGEGHFHSPC